MKKRQVKKIIKKYGENIKEFTDILSQYSLLQEKTNRLNLINPKTCGVNIKKYNYNLIKNHNKFLIKYLDLGKWGNIIPIKILRRFFPMGLSRNYLNIKAIDT